MFGRQIDPWASRSPFVPGCGNHEHFYNWTAYTNRYRLPKSEGSFGNFWWSYTYGNIHVVYMSTEHEFVAGTDQYRFIENDLKKYSAMKEIQWIIFGGHRPFLCSDLCEYGSHSPEGEFITAYQDMFQKYRVDIVFTGHMHCYERTYPFYKKVVTKGCFGKLIIRS